MKSEMKRKYALRHACTNCMNRPRRAALAIVVAVILLLNALTGSAAVAAASGNSGRVAATGSRSQFSDVNSGQWFEPFVSGLAVEGIISGYPDGSFRPQGKVTTGQFLAMVMQTGEWIAASSTTKQHWARPFYDAALEEELLFRDELPPASLDRPISRQWMAVIAVRMLAEEEATVVKGEEINIESQKMDFEEVLDSIKDVKEMTPYSYEIITAYQNGLLSGYPDGTFKPEGYLTRAEASVVIYKLKTLREDVTETKPIVKPDEPTCGYEDSAPEMTAGTRLFWCLLNSDRMEIKELMKRYVPDLEDQLYASFYGFAERASAEKNQEKQGLRKEYVGGYPVLMEAVGGEIRVYIKPKGSETRFWEVEPGQVSEEFF